MNRALRTVIVVGIALLMAGIASYAVYTAIERIPVREVEVARVYMVVAAKSLPVGTALSPDNVKLVPWPARSPVQGGFTRVEAVNARGLIVPVTENDLITESKLAPVGAGAGLSPTIPAGMRAISVKVNEVIGVAGFVVPGTHVDVLVTVNQQQDSMARTVVSNVAVLTAGTRYDQDKTKEGTPIPSTVVTLTVTPEDAEKIALAAGYGQIMLALRNPLDVQPTTTSGVRLAALMGPAAPPPVTKVVKGRPTVVAAPPPPPPAPKPYTVETIRAAKRSDETIKEPIK